MHPLTLIALTLFVVSALLAAVVGQSVELAKLKQQGCYITELRGALR